MAIWREFLTTLYSPAAELNSTLQTPHFSMASIFTHAFAAVALGSTNPPKAEKRKFFLWGMGCAMLPDADVIAFKFGTPYAHWLGHRGFTHSLVFAGLLALLIAVLAWRYLPIGSKEWWKIWLYLFLCTASHGLLDAFTTGGLGVALLAPIDNIRYFGPAAFRKIQVSPIGIKAFFSEWGLRVIVSELKWVWFPASLWMILMGGVRKFFAKN